MIQSFIKWVRLDRGVQRSVLKQVDEIHQASTQIGAATAETAAAMRSVHLQTLSIMDFIVSQCDVIFKYGVPGHRGWSAGVAGRPKPQNVTHHFFSWILLGSVPVCAAISFFRSPTVSSGLHFTRTEQEKRQLLCKGGSTISPFRPSLSFAII